MDPNALKPYQNAENIAAAATGMTLDYINLALSLEQTAADVIYRVVVHQELWVHRYFAVRIMIWSGFPCLDECQESSWSFEYE